MWISVWCCKTIYQFLTVEHMWISVCSYKTINQFITVEHLQQSLSVFVVSINSTHLHLMLSFFIYFLSFRELFKIKVWFVLGFLPKRNAWNSGSPRRMPREWYEQITNYKRWEERDGWITPWWSFAEACRCISRIPWNDWSPNGTLSLYARRDGDSRKQGQDTQYTYLFGCRGWFPGEDFEQLCLEEAIQSWFFHLSVWFILWHSSVVG